MAYITTEQVRTIRNELKDVFGKYGFRFSVRKEDNMSLHVSIMKGIFPPPNDKGYAQINHYHIDTQYEEGPIRDFLKLVVEICNRENWDKSDSMSDYYNVGYYFHIQWGKWDKPYEQVECK